MPVVDNAIYSEGSRILTLSTLEETRTRLDEHPEGFAWVGLFRPTPEEADSLISQFDFHPLALEEAYKGHHRAKIERYGHNLFVVLRPARYDDGREKVEVGEVHLVVGPNYVITIRDAESPDLAAVRRQLERHPDLLGLGPQAVLYAVLDRVVDEYVPVLEGIENDVDEIEDQLFAEHDDDRLSRRIYALYSEVADLGRAVHPLVTVLEWLHRGYEKYGVDQELQRRLRALHEKVMFVHDRARSSQQLLDKALTVHATLVAQNQAGIAQRQSEQMKKVSGWAAVLFAPTLIAGIYGMNFEIMPELKWPWGYPMALAAMIAFALALYAIFKTKKWM
ncbi:magnesium/cobalt transporter CorA [Microbacterium sediminicola]|uniref:Magnesium/cobalt transporter CorA n=1 Tax=Microbacterium sediminicola TaxID=415210 RepID=A0ABP4U7N8_9MICO